MAEGAINRRKSQLFLNNISPVTDTYNEVVKRKLKGGKFPGTITGIIKIVGMLVLLFALTFFLVQPSCNNTPYWHPYLFPSSCLLNILIQCVLFIIFSLGYTVKNPEFWIYLDMASILALSITTVVCSVLTFMTCQSNSIDNISAGCGIGGGVILIISCGAIFLMFRYVEDDEISDRPTQETKEMHEGPENPRKSVFA